MIKKIKQKKYLILFFIVTVIFVLYFSFYHNKKDYTSNFFSLDTLVNIKLSENYTSDLKDKITHYNDLFDNYNQNSTLYKLNLKKELECPKDLIEIINNTNRLSDIYGYDVDISSGALTKLWSIEYIDEYGLPTENILKEKLKTINPKNIKIENYKINLLNDAEIDLGSVAKGYILDKLYDFCIKKNLDYCIISFGSSSLLYSKSKKQFNIQIKAPYSEGVFGEVKTSFNFVSTAGTYERFSKVDNKNYHHIIDLKTGTPSKSNLTSVTVFCNNGLMSDFLSTFILLKGEENLNDYLNSDNYKVVAINNKNEVFFSEGLNFIKK